MIRSQEEFNTVMANVLAVRYLQLMGGKVEMTQMEIAEASKFGMQIKFKYPEQPATSSLTMSLITMEEAQKLIDQIRKGN